MILPALLAQVLGRESQTQIRPRVPESEGMAQYWMMTSPDADRCRTWRMCAVSIYGQRKLPPRIQGLAAKASPASHQPMYRLHGNVEQTQFEHGMDHRAL